MSFFRSTLTLFLLAIISSVIAAPLAPRGQLEKRINGKATYYDVGLGACGITNTNSQPIIAMNAAQYKKSVCGKWIRITNSQGKSARGYVEDLCPGCGYGHLDLSRSLFAKLGQMSKGVIPIKWNFSSSKKRDTPEEFHDEDSDEDFPPENEITEDDLLS